MVQYGCSKVESGSRIRVQWKSKSKSSFRVWRFRNGGFEMDWCAAQILEDVVSAGGPARRSCRGVYFRGMSNHKRACPD